MKERYEVYGRSLGALFTGSLTKCLRFMAFAIRDGNDSLTLQKLHEKGD